MVWTQSCAVISHFYVLGFRSETAAWRGTRRPSPSPGRGPRLGAAEQLATCSGHKRGRQGRARRNLHFDPTVSSGDARFPHRELVAIAPDVRPRPAGLRALMPPCFCEWLSLLCSGDPRRPHTASQREARVWDTVPRATSQSHTNAEKPHSVLREKQGRRSGPAWPDPVCPAGRGSEARQPNDL